MSEVEMVARVEVAGEADGPVGDEGYKEGVDLERCPTRTVSLVGVVGGWVEVLGEADCPEGDKGSAGPFGVC